MKIGITFGGYCPLHQGHMDLIMRSKKENDLTYVFVCGYDGEPRAESYNLPLDKRYRIIANFLEDEMIRVRKISDTELGLDQSMSPENWTIWLKEIYKIIIQDRDIIDDDITWYVGEPRYVLDIKNNSELANISIEIVDRNINVVSGTKCRENPLKYWRQITPPFRAYFSHNILFAGTASEGKTNMARDIGRYYAFPYSYEKGRDNCALKPETELSIKDFIYNIYEQHKYNEDLICSPQNPGIFISDTDNIVTLMYAERYAERDNFLISEEDFDLLYALAKVYRPTTKWDKIFLFAPHEKPIVDDGERYMEDSDYKIRRGFFATLKQLYDEFGYEYEILDGNYYENYKKIRGYIDELYTR